MLRTACVRLRGPTFARSTPGVECFGPSDTQKFFPISVSSSELQTSIDGLIDGLFEFNRSPIRVGSSCDDKVNALEVCQCKREDSLRETRERDIKRREGITDQSELETNERQDERGGERVLEKNERQGQRDGERIMQKKRIGEERKNTNDGSRWNTK